MPFCAWLCKKLLCGGDLCCGRECGGGRVFHAESGIFRAGKIVIGQHLHADAVGKGLCESSDLFRLIGVVVRHKGIADLKRLAAGVDAAQILKDTAVGAPRGGDVDILIDGFEDIEKSIGAGQQLYGAAADVHRRREKDDFAVNFLLSEQAVFAPFRLRVKNPAEMQALIERDCDSIAACGDAVLAALYAIRAQRKETAARHTSPGGSWKLSRPRRH